MKIYVGRWDLLPYDWEGINGLEIKSEEEIVKELAREIEEYDDNHPVSDNRMGIYTPGEFENEFNYDTKGRLTTDIYWIKIF